MFFFLWNLAIIVFSCYLKGTNFRRQKFSQTKKFGFCGFFADAATFWSNFFLSLCQFLREMKISRICQNPQNFCSRNFFCLNNISKNVGRYQENVKKTSIRTSQLNIGGKIIDNDKEIATNFNNFFVNVVPSTENRIPKVLNISPSKFLKNRNQINFVIAHVSNEEILEIMNSLENKSTGPSSIPLGMLSVIPDLIILPLAYIIDMSILTGVYPDLLKNS